MWAVIPLGFFDFASRLLVCDGSIYLFDLQCLFWFSSYWKYAGDSFVFLRVVNCFFWCFGCFFMVCVQIFVYIITSSMSVCHSWLGYHRSQRQHTWRFQRRSLQLFAGGYAWLGVLNILLMSKWMVGHSYGVTGNVGEVCVLVSCTSPEGHWHRWNLVLSSSLFSMVIFISSLSYGFLQFFYHKNMVHCCKFRCGARDNDRLVYFSFVM